MASVRVGPGRSDATQLGPMVNARRRDAIAATVAAAADGGARVRLGADVPDGPGFFYPPTVLDGVARDACLVADEIFGPVAPVVTVVDDEDAVTVANGSELGLAAYAYTGDLRRGLALAERLEVGMVGLNRGLVSDPAAPFGGVKESGLGREGGFEGIHEYLEIGCTAVDW
jgi:succinate-semialdehyde dehydrogenase/glutarate-semialdehyde dehydrogenase